MDCSLASELDAVTSTPTDPAVCVARDGKAACFAAAASSRLRGSVLGIVGFGALGRAVAHIGPRVRNEQLIHNIEAFVVGEPRNLVA